MAREFWIREHKEYDVFFAEEFQAYDDDIHVIEKSAYDELRKEVDDWFLKHMDCNWIAAKDATFNFVIKEKADRLADALESIVYGEPKDNATTYPYAEEMLKEYRGEE